MPPPLLLALCLAAALAGCRGDAQPLPDATWAEIAALDPATYAAPSPCGASALRLDGSCGDPMTAFAAAGGTTHVVDQRHPAATDAGPGTAERPWRTISQAARRGVLRPGDAVVVRAGIYRESVRPESGGTPGRPITFAAHPGEAVVISGADPAPEGWERVGAAWRRAWTLPPMEAYSDEAVFRRELVVAGGAVLRHAASRAELRPGTFWMEGPDVAPRAVWVRLADGVSPASVEIASRDVLFGPLGPDPYVECADASQPGHLRIVGFQLRHAANRAQVGALCAGSAGSRVEDVAVEWTNGVGVDASGDGHLFQRVRADHHGQLGWMGHGRGTTIEDGTAVGNNWKGYDMFWEAGGGKWDRSSELVIRRHYAAWNDGPGIWLDGDNDRCTIEDSRAVSNAMAGVMLELDTRRTLVQHTVATGTRWRAWSGSGLLSQAASRNVIAHNTFADNEGIGLWLRLDDGRRARDGWTTVTGNRVVGNAREPSVEAREIAVEGTSAAHLATYRIDGNLYGAVGERDATMRSAFFAYAPSAEGAPGVEVRSDDLDAWRRGTGFDARSAQIRRRGDDARLGAPLALPDAGATRAPAVPTSTIGAAPGRQAWARRLDVRE